VAEYQDGVADSALFCVARGTGIALEHLDTYKKASSRSDKVYWRNEKDTHCADRDLSSDWGAVWRKRLVGRYANI
jgi:hypothetical protein